MSRSAPSPAKQSPPSARADGAAPHRSQPAWHRYRIERATHWSREADRPPTRWSAYYHRRLARLYRHIVARGQRVLELGCGHGDLLAAVEPAEGVGVDCSAAMVRQAQQRHPRLRFVVADAHELPLAEPFDVVILSDLVHDIWDVQTVFEQVARVSTPRTRIIINSYSRLWELPLGLIERMGLARPVLRRNWLTVSDIGDLLRNAGLELIRSWEEILWPLATPLFDPALNRYLVRLWPFNKGALTNVIVARLAPAVARRPVPRVSVIVPARNEAGNIEAIFERTPELGAGTELIFVEGGSSDQTFEVICAAAARHPQRACVVLQQTGKGKGDAVRRGFASATGEVLMILDADLTVPPEDLPRFYEALWSGKGDFINGVRLIYPMEEEAMRMANLLSNKFFSLAFSYILGQPIKDTLCGTKALWRADYEHIAANRSFFGEHDPFGDFDLLLGAAKLNLKILGMPIRYCERTYGTTNISRWQHGALLLKMLLVAMRRLKFV